MLGEPANLRTENVRGMECKTQLEVNDGDFYYLPNLAWASARSLT
jgi:hypothetical protein